MADAIAPGADEDTFTFESAANKEFPLCPEGPAKAIVAGATLKMKKKSPKYVKKGEDPNKEYPYVSLKLQTDKEYTDESGAKKPHNVFMSMKVSDHKDSVMFDFFQSVMGITVPLNAEKKISLVTKRIKKEDGTEFVVFPQFENLEFGIIVKHGKSEDGSKTFDNVDSLYAEPDQKGSNAALFRAPSA